MFVLFVLFFFFKQKTAYEMRISDWSSDVCTSIAELFRRLLSERALSFKLEDFSLGCHECFWTAFDAFRGGAAQSDVLAHLPSITITLDIAYDVDAPDLGPLSACILHLTPDC